MMVRIRHWARRVCAAAVLFGTALTLLAPGDASAQVVRPYSIRYQINTNGDIAHIGNTIMTCPASADCTSAQAGIANPTGVNNNDFTMNYVDVDGDAFGPTFNSSNADLNLPAGAVVKFAGLYWGGVSASASRNQMLLKTPATGGYSAITASQVDGSNFVVANNYAAFADVTALVLGGGNGTYWGANIQSANGGAGMWGGWALIIVYESNTKPLRNLVVYDGYSSVSGAGSTFSLSGFLTPYSGPVITQVGSFGLDGDLGFTGDTLQVRSSTNPVFQTISDAQNPGNNFYNSTVSDGGVAITTRNPPYANTLGVDLDRFTLPAGVVGNGATGADIQVTTTGDQYLPVFFTWATDIYVPIITPNIVKTSTDLNGGTLQPGDILRWNISMSNTGMDTGTNLVLVDPIPAGTTYVPGSLVINTAPAGAALGGMNDAIAAPLNDQADFRTGPNRVVFRLGTGAGTGNPANDQANGGNLAFGQSTSLQFDTVVNNVAAGTVISNSATIYYSGQTLSTQTFSSTSSATAAVLGAPTIAKSFTPASIAVGGTAQLKVTIANPAANSGNLTGVSFTDNFPSGVTVASPPAVNATCTAGSTAGTVTGGIAAGSSIGMSPGATIAPGGSCDITVNVTATPAGNYVNTISAVTATNATSGAGVSATLTAGKLSISKSFTPSTVRAGVAASLSVTITNPTASAVTGVAFTDLFPANLVIAGAPFGPFPATPCGAGSTLLNGGGGALAAGNTGISMTNGQIAANSSCTFAVNVTGTTAATFGIFNNTTGGVTYTGDAVAGNPSNTAALTIVGAPTVTKTMSPAIINAGDTSTVTITLTNPNTSTTITRAATAFTDTYNPGTVNTNPANVTLNCSGASSASIVGGAAGGTTVGMQNVSLAPLGSCTVTSVVLPSGAAPTSGTNTTGVVTFDNAPAAAAASAIYTVTALTEPTVTKSFSSTAVSAGSAVTMTITLVNPSTAAASPATNLAGVAFTDTFPLGMVNTTGAAVIGGAAGCTGGTATVTPGVLSLSGLSVPSSNVSLANRTCTVTTTVAASAPGAYFNSTGTVTSTNAPPQTIPGTATLSTYRGLDVVKSFAPNSIAPGGVSVLTLTITNPSGNPGAISASNIVDNFPAGLTAAAPAPGGTLTNCPGATLHNGTIGAARAAGDTSFGLNGASIAVGVPCVVSINVTATAGNYLNTVAVVSSSASVSGTFPVAITGTSNSALLSAGKIGITKAFAPATINTGGTTILTFTLTNTAAVAVTGVNFTDLLTSLPTRQLTLASGAVGGTCTGVVSNAVAGGTSLVVTAGNVPASSFCRITVQVTSNVVGIHPNQTSGVSHAADGVAGAPSNIANLTVTPPPTVTKAFLPTEVAAGGRATLSVTITNINNFPVTGVSVIDTFPTGLLVATPLLTNNSCGGTLTNSGGGALAAGDAGIALSGGTVATNSSCVIAISVTAAVAGAYVNSIAAGALTSSAGANQNPASATLNVLLPLSPVLKLFTPNAIPVGGTSVITVRLTNPNAFAVTGVAFTDTYPANLFNTAAPAGSTSCPGGSVTAAANGSSLALSGATVPANNFCDITVNVTSSVSGVRTNPAFNVTSTNAGTAVSNPADLSVGVPSITKTFSPNPVAPGGVSTISFVISNPTGAAMTNVGFIDNFPAGMTLANAALAAQCGGTLYNQAGVTPPPAASTGIRLGNAAGVGGGTVAANSTCTVLAAVTTPTAGVRINTTGVVTAGALVGDTATDTLTTFSPPTVTKSFAPAAAGINSPVVLTIRLDNPNAFPMSGAAFTDAYPANLVNSASPGGATTCSGGVVSATSGVAQVALSGAAIVPASGFCLVTVNVAGITAGALVNTLPIGAVTTTNAGSNTVASNNATLTVLAPPTVVKDFIGPSYVVPFGLAGTTMPLNTSTVMRIRLTNPSLTTAITGAAFSDNYPVGLVNIGIPNPAISGAGCTGTLSAIGGGTSLGLTGLTIPANTTCTITESVQASISSFYTNSTGPVTTANAGTAAAASATIYAMAPLLVSKSFTPNFIVNPPGTATSNMQVSLVNPNPYPVTGAAITDNYDSGNIKNVNPPLPSLTGTAGCSGTITAANAASAMTFATGVVPTSGTCVINVTVNLTPAGTNGVFTNCTDGITTANAGASADACAAITKAATPTTLPPVIAKTFTPSTIAVNGASALLFTVTNSNTVGITTVAFTDVLPAGLVVATPALPSSNCGAGVWNATAGSTVLSLTGGTITASASCVLNVMVTGNASGVYNNVSGTVSANTGSGNQAAATLTILDPPAITKAFAPSAISQGGMSSISFVVSNNNSVAVTSVAFTDTLTNMSIVNPPAPSVSGAGCSGFTVTAPNGGSLISVSGGSVPARVGVTPGTCTITVQVTSVVAGNWPNATSQTTSSAGTGNGSNTAILTVNAVTSGVSGYVFVDTNANGTRNLAEDWSAGVIVYVNIVSGGAVVQSQAVNPGTGFFNFPSVPFGSYTILVSNSPANATVAVPGGFTATQPTGSTWNLLINGTAVPSQDFGFVGPALSQVSGRVFRDTGFAGGTANDGVLTPGEAGSSPGLSGVVVAVTDCAAITFATVNTDGGGNYTLRFPSTATNVCIVETNISGYLSTGASQDLTVIPPGTCAAPPGGGVFEYQRSADRICFSKTAGSNVSYTGLNFGDVPANTFVADQTQQVAAANFVLYPHVFTYETGGTVSFGTTVVATNPNITGWGEVMYRDNNCDGKLDNSEPIITAATTVPVTAVAPPGNKVCVILKEFAPPAAPFGAQRVVRVDASFVYTNASPGLSATYARTDTTVTGDSSSASGLSLVKEVCNETTTTCTDTALDPSSLAANGNYGTANTARPNDVLRYRIVYTNTASSAVTNVVINDSTPPFTDYVASTCASTPTGLVCTPTTTPPVCVANASCAVRWALTGGALNAGAQGIVVYRVSVRP